MELLNLGKDEEYKVLSDFIFLPLLVGDNWFIVASN